MIVENVEVLYAQLTETDENGKYMLLFGIKDKKANAALVQTFKDKWKESGYKGKPQWMPNFTSETSEKYPDKNKFTGMEIFKCVANDKFGSPKVYDSKNVPIFNPQIGKGSIVNLSVSPYAYDNASKGVTLFIDGVQIVELKAYEGGDTFGEVEGFVADTFEGNDTDKPKKKKKKKKK